MRSNIKIRAGMVEASAWLNETHTAAKVLEILPLTSVVNIWGDEIYFMIPVDTELENGEETIALGDMAYWPEGNALCIFLGKTPISRGDEIRPASAVSIIGRIEGSGELFQSLLMKFRQGEQIQIDRQVVG